MKCGIFVFAMLIASRVVLAQHSGAAYKMPDRGLCAHRGCMETHPENTLPAFYEAIRLGAQMIEFDIRFTKDDVMVLMHDATVDRTTDGKGEISDLSFEQVRLLDAGFKKGIKFKGTPVPTFEETLAMMPLNVWLNCHIKGDEEEGRAVADLIARSGRLHQAFLTCSVRAADAARTVAPSILICNVESRYRNDTPQYASETVKMKADFIQLLRPKEGEDRSAAIRLLRENRVKVNYFYAAEPGELAGLYQQGVDFPLVNDLAAFLPEAGRIGISPLEPVFRK